MILFFCLIVSGWRSLGWPLPTVMEETRPDYVVLTMRLGTNSDKKTPQENPTRKPSKKDLRKKQLLEFCIEPKYLSEIMQFLGLRDRKNVMDVYISPMIVAGVLEMTEPDNPTSRNQMYVTAKLILRK